MSRLFSRLENVSQSRSENAVSPAHPEPDEQPATAASPARFAEPGAAPLPAGASTVQALVPGYAIPSHLSMPPAPALTRPDWTVRLWLFSLLFLMALSLLMLALPERMYPLFLQRPAPAAAQADAAPVAPVPASVPAASTPASPPAVQPLPAEPAPAPAARAPRPETRTSPPPVVRAPTSPAVPASGASACSEAMLALNLCSPSSP